MSSATARVAPDMLQALAILSDTTVRRCAVDRKGLKGLIVILEQDAACLALNLRQWFKNALC